MYNSPRLLLNVQISTSTSFICAIGVCFLPDSIYSYYFVAQYFSICGRFCAMSYLNTGLSCHALFISNPLLSLTTYLAISSSDYTSSVYSIYCYYSVNFYFASCCSFYYFSSFISNISFFKSLFFYSNYFFS